jgi:hypothetical protein
MTTATQSPGVIRADESYTQAEFCRRAGLARKAYLSARRQGLKVVEFGKKRFVLGSDWIAFLQHQASKQSASYPNVTARNICAEQIERRADPLRPGDVTLVRLNDDDQQDDAGKVRDVTP